MFFCVNTNEVKKQDDSWEYKTVVFWVFFEDVLKLEQFDK